jgi:ribosomal protein S18 acetylase RimI-like enzyme
VRNGTALRVIDQLSFLAKLDALIDVYALAMRPPTEQLAGRRSIMERHSGHPAFRAVIAAAGGEGHGEDNEDSEDSEVIAFAYGFCGASGQWWHDVVRAGLTVATGQRAAAGWLADSFEIAEVHVHPEHQRQGIGRAMLLSLTAGCRQRTALLSTLCSAAPARRLYGSLGFAELLTGFSFPGNGPPYVVMGAVLPLRADARPAG